MKLTAVVALTGTETTTATASAEMQATSEKLAKEKVGDKTPLRLFLDLSCDAFLVDGESWNESLKDSAEHAECTGSSLDLADLDAGKPLSLMLSPREMRGWAIQAIAPGFISFSIGEGTGEDLQITGIKYVETKMGAYLDMGSAHLAWNYSVNDGGFGSSRVELAADCPAMK